MTLTELADRVRGLFLENASLKALSLAFALVLYSLVHDAQDAQRVVEVGVVVRVPPDSSNRLLTSQSATKVRVTLRGSRAALDDIHADDVGAVQVDAHGGTELQISLSPEMVHVPPGVRVEDIDPPVIDLSWEDEVVRDLPIEASVVGSPANGYVVKGAPSADPATVRVHGPKTEVLTLQHARADAFDVSGLTEGTYTRALSIDRRASLKYDVTDVKVTAVVARELVERPFPRLTVAVLGNAKAKAQPSEVDVRLTCPPEVVRALRPEQVVPEVEVKAKDPTGAMALPVTVNVDKCDSHVTPSNVVVRW